MFTQTLILNHAYRPKEIVDWKDAVTRMFTGKIDVLVQYDEVLARIDRQTLATFPQLRRALRQVIGTDAESLEIKVPAVAVLRRKVSFVRSRVKFSRLNICLRDDFRCQYCGKKLPMSRLNYDHVVPRSRGGKTSWDNIVMACYECNSAKANQTLEEAGLALLTTPRQPDVLPVIGPRIDLSQVPPEWEPFIRVA